MRTLGCESFQSLEIWNFKKFIKIWISRKVEKSLHRNQEHYVLYHCANFENKHTSGFREESILNMSEHKLDGWRGRRRGHLTTTTPLDKLHQPKAEQS